MKKLLAILVLMVSMVLLVGCQAKEPDILVIEVDKDFQDYDYAIGEVIDRKYSFVNKTYTYTIRLENGEIGEVVSSKLFSLLERVLVIEYEENNVILVDLS